MTNQPPTDPQPIVLITGASRGIGFGAVAVNDSYRGHSLHRLTASRINDMRVADALMLVVALVIARSEDALVAVHFNRSQHPFPLWMAHSDTPWLVSLAADGAQITTGVDNGMFDTVAS